MSFLECILLAASGAVAGSVVNLAVYRLAWYQRCYSPWSAPLETAPPRHWADRIPILGWFGLRREASLHGAGFWIRPMLVEVAMAAGIVALYWWEVERLGLIRPMIMPPPIQVLQAQFAVHALLMTLMLAGSLIDADEKTIPDGITVSGTLVGLFLAAAYPKALLPDVERAIAWPGVVAALPSWDFLRLSSPNLWPRCLSGAPEWKSLAIAAVCWWGWCFALMPRTWYSRHGWRRAIRLSVARLRREAATYVAAGMGVVGAVLIALVWRQGGPHWQGLLSSLVGMAVGGGIIWAVRIIATCALRREAMGFGDVTLMAMIGSFLGWQACLMIFFLAPFAGLLVGIFSLLLHRQPEIPYGPFLCLAAAVLTAAWGPVWDRMEPVFLPVDILAGIFVVGLVLMAGLLWLWRVLGWIFVWILGGGLLLLTVSLWLWQAILG